MPAPKKKPKKPAPKKLYPPKPATAGSGLGSTRIPKIMQTGAPPAHGIVLDEGNGSYVIFLPPEQFGVPPLQSQVNSALGVPYTGQPATPTPLQMGVMRNRLPR